MFEFPMNDEICLIRDGKQIHTKMYVLSQNDAQAPIDVGAEEGDEFRFQNWVRVIAEVNRLPAEGHTKIRLVSKTEWRSMNNREETKVSQSFHIGNAGAVAGRDMHGVNVEMTFLNMLEQAIKNDPTIPEAARKGILARLSEILTDPTVISAAVTAVKSWWSSAGSA